MGISFWQILLIVIVVVLLFGAGKIPRLMGDVAKGIRSFKTGLKDDESESESQPSQSPPRQIDSSGQPASGTGHTASAHNDETART